MVVGLDMGWDLGYDVPTTKTQSGIKSRPERACFLCLFILKVNPNSFCDKNHFKTSYDGLREPNTIPSNRK